MGLLRTYTGYFEEIKMRNALLILIFFVLVVGCKSKKQAPETAAPEAKASEKAAVEEAKPAAAEEKSADSEAKGEAEAAAQDGLSDPVAEVNGNQITAADFREALKRYERPGLNIPEERLGRIKKSLLNRLVDDKLIEQAISKDKVEVDKQKLEDDFNKYKGRFKNEDQYKQYLDRSGMTQDRIRDQLKKTLLVDALLERRGTLSVPEAEVKSYYEKHKNLYAERETVHAAHILIKVAKDADDATVAEAKKRIEEARKALKKKDFAEVAKEMSEGPSAPRGGDLGFFGKGQMVKEFEEVAFKMKKNKVSKPVRTPFGFHIIKVIEKKKARTKPFEEVKPRLSESLRRKKFAQQKRDLLKSLRDQATIVTHAKF